MQYAGGDRDVEGTGRTTTATAPTTTPSAKGEGNNRIPEGWHRVDDPEGFSLLVPDGWKRQVTDGQIDYTPDGGNHRIRISVDRSPDFESPYVHALDLEGALGKRMHYKRVQLSQKVYRDQTLSCLWEFTWTEKKNFPGPRHAIDQMYYGDDGTEYAVYMSSPESSWETTGSSSTSSSGTGGKRGSRERSRRAGDGRKISVTDPGIRKPLIRAYVPVIAGAMCGPGENALPTGTQRAEGALRSPS